MRILAGDFKYKRLNYIKDKKLRPTRSIVRKSFFDTIRSIINDSIFLDLFAGVGSIGLEAASRGAKEVVFVDRSFRSIDIIKKNIGEFGSADRFRIIHSNAFDFLDSAIMKQADIVYIDAPYGFDVNNFLKEFFGKINKNAIVCVEHLKNKHLDEGFSGFSKIKSRSFGKNSLDYFEVVNE